MIGRANPAARTNKLAKNIVINVAKYLFVCVCFWAQGQGAIYYSIVPYFKKLGQYHYVHGRGMLVWSESGRGPVHTSMRPSYPQGVYSLFYCNICCVSVYIYVLLTVVYLLLNICKKHVCNLK